MNSEYGMQARSETGVNSRPQVPGLRRKHMQVVDRRRFLGRASTAVGLAATMGGLVTPRAFAQGAPIKLKFGNDLPATHSVNVRLREAIEAIAAETNGRVTINLFP